MGALDVLRIGRDVAVHEKQKAGGGAGEDADLLQDAGGGGERPVPEVAEAVADGEAHGGVVAVAQEVGLVVEVARLQVRERREVGCALGEDGVVGGDERLEGRGDGLDGMVVFGDAVEGAVEGVAGGVVDAEAGGGERPARGHGEEEAGGVREDAAAVFAVRGDGADGAAEAQRLPQADEVVLHLGGDGAGTGADGFQDLPDEGSGRPLGDRAVGGEDGTAGRGHGATVAVAVRGPWMAMLAMPLRCRSRRRFSASGMSSGLWQRITTGRPFLRSAFSERRVRARRAASGWERPNATGAPGSLYSTQMGESLPRGWAGPST